MARHGGHQLLVTVPQAGEGPGYIRHLLVAESRKPTRRLQPHGGGCKQHWARDLDRGEGPEGHGQLPHLHAAQDAILQHPVRNRGHEVGVLVASLGVPPGSICDSLGAEGRQNPLFLHPLGAASQQRFVDHAPPRKRRDQVRQVPGARLVEGARLQHPRCDSCRETVVLDVEHGEGVGEAGHVPEVALREEAALQRPLRHSPREPIIVETHRGKRPRQVGQTLRVKSPETGLACPAGEACHQSLIAHPKLGKPPGSVGNVLGEHVRQDIRLQGTARQGFQQRSVPKVEGGERPDGVGQALGVKALEGPRRLQVPRKGSENRFIRDPGGRQRP
mmetsp:Transcript_152812/g.266989  ORF Transcript_152812/g.266989 Transcript_152812/m.266989 type:complete len:332 (+) Transcript_152812:1760-2755(+)